MVRRASLGIGLLVLATTCALGFSSGAFAADPVVPQGTYPSKFDIKQQYRTQSLGKVQFLRRTAYAPTPKKAISRDTATYKSLVTNRPIPRLAGNRLSQPSDYQTVGSMPISGKPSKIVAKTGLTGYDQEAYGGYALEPPDSELCAGDGQIIQVVNDLVGVWDQAGNELSPPMAFEYFLSDFDNTLTDPKCYWDPDTKHFFITILAYPSSFDGSGIYIAVSQTSNALGGWNIYFLDTTNPFDNANCATYGCLADQPLLGADKWTLQISTNEFDWGTFGFNGAGYFFVDKTALALGLPFPNVVGANFADITTPDGDCPTDGSGAPCWYSVQPAESPNGNYDVHWNGTSLAMSALDFYGALDDRIALWLWTNTKTIASVSPDIFLDGTTVTGGAYGAPPLGVQPSGYNPSGYWLWGADPFATGGIETNDDRMNEVEYNARTGWLMGGLNTGAYVTNSSHFRSAALATAIQLRWFGSVLVLVNGRQNYIANYKADVLFPASTSVNSGNGIWAYTVTGDEIFPSSAISTFTNSAGPSKIIVSNPGAGPQDGFCEYYAPCQPGRWGDYSGAVTDGNKVFWSSEFIDQVCTFDEYFADTTCGGTRGFYINWANSLAGTVLP